MPERMLDLEPLEARRRRVPPAGLPELPMLTQQQSADTEAQLQEYLRQKNKPMLPYSYGTLNDDLPPLPVLPAPSVPPELTQRGVPMGRNPRTGARMYETGPGLLDESTEGVPQMASGAFGVLHEPGMRGKAGAASELIRGAMRTASPLMAGPVAAAPGASAAALGYGTLLGTGTESALNAAGVPPEYAAAAGDVAGLMGGGYVGKVAHSRPWRTQGRLGEFISSESGEMALPRRGHTSEELTAQQREQLTPQQQDVLETAKAKDPEFAQAAAFLTPQEAGKLADSPKSIEAFNRLTRALPQAANMSAVAKAGAPKRGWYRASSQAIMDVFGPEDAPRFAQLLASLSPQTSVESNLMNTLNVWKNWTASGRPRDPQQIRAVLGASVQGGKGEASVLPAWIGNATSVLTAESPKGVTLSGPKVDSFYRNLLDDVYRVTNDTWMANAFGVSQELFGGSPTELQKARGDPGLSPEYMATNARVRESAQQAGMFPREGQETIWSVALKLYRLAEENGISPREVLQRGLLTPEEIGGTPDFSTLFRAPEYGKVLEQSGYEKQLSGLKPYPFPEPRGRSLSLPEQREVENTADVLGRLMKQRGQESSSRAVPGIARPEEYASEQAEYITGGATKHLPGLRGSPYGSRKAFTGMMGTPFEDAQGRDLLQSATGLDPLPGRGMQGAYKPRGAPVETNWGKALPVPVPVTIDPETNLPDIPGDTKTRLNAAAALRGAMTAQEGSTWNVGIPKEGGQSLRLPLQKAVPEDVMKTAVARYPKLIFADTGAGMNIINFTGKMLSGRQRLNLEKLFQSGKAIETHNVSDYIDYADDWAKQPGSGDVTRKMFSYVDQLKPEDYARVDQAVRYPASRIEQIYATRARTQKEPIREDLMNLLRIIRDKGIDGAKQALESGAFLPGLIGALLLPAMFDKPSEAASAE